MMPIRWQKKIWTGLLLMSAGGTLTLLVLSIVLQVLAPMIWWSWPPLTLVSALALVRCYRKEPSDLRGFWHLRLEDLVFAGLYLGLLLAILKPLLGLWFPLVGIVFSFCQAIGLIVGCLAAQRNGCTARGDKLLYAFAYGTRLVGLVAAGAIVAVILMDGLTFNAPFMWLKAVCLGTGYVSDEEHPFVLLHRMTLACLPVGMLLMAVVSRGIRKVPSLPQRMPVSIS